MAKALQRRKAALTIHKITDPSGKSFTSPEDISTQFVNYFTKLYNLPQTDMTDPSQNRQEAISTFLAQHGIPLISPEESRTLDCPISMEETTTALKQLKAGKSPGPDGLTVGYYKTFQETLTPHFTKAFNTLSASPQNNKDLLEAHITLIPKPGKDDTLVTNYRPISLLNVDLKLYAKILANRLLPFIPDLVSLDRVGFVPGREARDNTIKAPHIHHFLSSSSHPK